MVKKTVYGKQQLDPVTAAILKVKWASKQAASLRSSMTPILLREMAYGADPKNDMFETSKPSLFAGRLGFTYETENRKAMRKNIEPPKLRNVQYDFHSSIIPNELDESTGMYFPDLLGKKMHAKSVGDSVIQHERKLFNGHAADEESILHVTSMADIVGADITNEHTHKFLSLICKKEKYLTRELNKFIPGPLHAYKDDITDALVRMTSDESPFRHEIVSFDVLPTADYTVYVSSTKHFFYPTHAKYGIEVEKKIVFASVNGSIESRINVPMCEELAIQLKVPDPTAKKGNPLLVNHNEGLFLACSMGQKKNEYMPAYLHYFGENAFTIGYEGKTSNLTEDKTKICARLSGALIREINNLYSTDISKMTTSVNFFKDMFDFENYKMDEGDTVHYSSLFQLQAQGPTVTKKIEQITMEHDKNQKDKDEHTRSRLDKKSIEMVLCTFLKRQKNVRSLIEINEGKFPDTIKWWSGQSFSFIVMSPFGMNGKRYIFLLTYSGINTTTKGGSKFQLPNKKPPRSTLGSQAPSLKSPVPTMVSQAPSLKTPVPPPQRGVRSVLTPDLEEELNAMF